MPPVVNNKRLLQTMYKYDRLEVKHMKKELCNIIKSQVEKNLREGLIKTCPECGRKYLLDEERESIEENKMCYACKYMKDNSEPVCDSCGEQMVSHHEERWNGYSEMIWSCPKCDQYRETNYDKAFGEWMHE